MMASPLAPYRLVLGHCMKEQGRCKKEQGRCTKELEHCKMGLVRCKLASLEHCKLAWMGCCKMALALKLGNSAPPWVQAMHRLGSVG
jgi:hypothetical protein